MIKMMHREVEQGTFTFDDLEKQVGKRRWAVQVQAQAQECSMCGDVGFADQLQQCARCHFRYQHTYCCNSKEGLLTASWICDWCRLVKDKTKAEKETQPAGVTCSVLSGEAKALECLLKAALIEARHDSGVTSESADGGSLCSSSIESVKGDDASCGVPEAPSCCSSEDRISQGEETVSAFPSVLPRGSSCDPKPNHKIMRCTRISQKRKHRSVLAQQCGSVQLNRLTSLKNSKTAIACDPPKSFVRRYKSLSDISF